MPRVRFEHTTLRTSVWRSAQLSYHGYSDARDRTWGTVHMGSVVLPLHHIGFKKNKRASRLALESPIMGMLLFAPHSFKRALLGIEPGPPAPKARILPLNYNA